MTCPWKRPAGPVMMLAAVLAAGCGDGGGGGNPDADEDTTGDPSAEVAMDVTEDTVDETVDEPVDDPMDDPADEPMDDPVDDPTDVEEESAACLPEATPTGDEGHRAGQDCLSCHASMGGGRRWTLAGTLYNDASGSAPVSGATIVVTEAGGTEHLLVTHPNGNFYTTAAVTFPVTVAASKCPDHAEMGSTVSDGSCNSCHNSTFRIHLP